MGNGNSERREAKRVDTLKVELFIEKGGVLQKEASLIRNISTKGFSCLSSCFIEEGSEIRFSLYLPGEIENINIEGKGKCCWIRLSDFFACYDRKIYEIGIEFADLKEGDLDKICKYVLRRLYKPR